MSYRLVFRHSPVGFSGENCVTYAIVPTGDHSASPANFPSRLTFTRVRKALAVHRMIVLGREPDTDTDTDTDTDPRPWQMPCQKHR